MSVVLYVLGAALLVWGGLVFLTGDAFATLDIAASLAGSGAFTIGLGAIVGGLAHLSRTIADAADARETAVRPRAPQPAPARRPPPPEPRERVSPPARLPEAQPPKAEPRAPEPRAPESRAPKPRPPARPVAEASVPVAPEPTALTTRVLPPEIETPVVVAPALGGGVALRRADEPPIEPIDPIDEPPAEPERPFGAPAPRRDETAPETAAEDETGPFPPPEPKVPDWLAKARARRQARAEMAQAAAVAVPVPLAAAAFGPQPKSGADADDARAETDERDGLPTDDDAEIWAPEATDPSRVVLREGEHNGVLYRFFEDGAVEAISEHGVRRFGSVEELRATILAVRGQTDDDAEEPAPGDEPNEPDDNADAPAPIMFGPNAEAEPESASQSRPDEGEQSPEAGGVGAAEPLEDDHLAGDDVDAGGAEPVERAEPVLRATRADRVGDDGGFEAALAELEGGLKDADMRLNPRDDDLRATRPARDV